MNHLRNIFAVAALFFCFSAFAQGPLEEVIYMKDGSVLRGVIIETIPNESYKIEIAGGSVFTVRQSEVTKITKEPRAGGNPRMMDGRPAPDGYRRDERAHMDRHGYERRYEDSNRVPHYKKRRGYFFVGELRAGPDNGGIRVVNGVKFGRFGYLGIGVGIDGAVMSDHNMWPGSWENNNSGESDGLYLPLYLRYSGDILRKRITPFYYVEAGYAAHPTNLIIFDDNSTQSWGGPMGAIGFGAKFNTRRRVNFNININVNFRSNYFREDYYLYDQFGNYYLVQSRQWDRKIFGCAGFGIGF